MRKCFLSTLATTAVLSGALGAGELYVPGDFPELQDAIDSALPGDTIIVQGGVFDPITIDKPLTIVGEPRPWIRFDMDTSPGQPLPAPAAVTLAGDGTGVVVLRNLQIGPGYLGYLYYLTEPAILGGGFEELHLHDCHVQASYFYVPEGDCCFRGRAALWTDIPEVLIAHSTLVASPSDSGVCDYFPERPDPAIVAPASTVVLLGSQVEGGGQFWLCTPGDCLDPDVLVQTLLAPGIDAATLFQVDSTVVGGHAGFWGHATSFYPTVIEPCGTSPVAPGLAVGKDVSFTPRLRAFTDLRLGQTWTVYWNASGGFSTLFLSTRALLPPLEMSVGWLFVDFEGLLAPRTYQGSGIRRFDYGVPRNTSLIGVEIVGQIYDGTGLTHPIADCVGPEVTATEKGVAQAL